MSNGNSGQVQNEVRVRSKRMCIWVLYSGMGSCHFHLAQACSKEVNAQAGYYAPRNLEAAAAHKFLQVLV
jgi:predicted phage gp36 major capsid-like protein